MAVLGGGTKVFQDLRKKQKEKQKQEAYVKDIQDLLQEPTKGNAIRIISKRVLEYVFELSGGPGVMIKAMYGRILNHLIDALYFSEKEEVIREKLQKLNDFGKEAKENSTNGISKLLKGNEFDKKIYMPTVFQYCLLIGWTDPKYRKQYPRTLELKLTGNTKKRIQNFDTEIIYFLAVDTFIRKIPQVIEGMKKELSDPSNRIETAIRVGTLQYFKWANFDALVSNNFNGGLGRNIDKYIQLRNEWAMWINHPAMTRAKYEEAVLPHINYD